MFVEYTKDQVKDFLIERTNEFTYYVPFSPRHGHTFHYVKYDGIDVEYLYWDGVDYIEETAGTWQFSLKMHIINIIKPLGHMKFYV